MFGHSSPEHRGGGNFQLYPILRLLAMMNVNLSEAEANTQITVTLTIEPPKHTRT